MRSIILIVLSVFLVSVVSNAQYKIKVKIDNYPNDTCVLGHTFGDKTYIDQKLTKPNKKGEFIFEGEESLPGGMYVILVKPQNVYFQFLISDDEDQKDISIYTKIEKNVNADLNDNLKIENSPDNEAFLDYKKFLLGLRDKATNYRTKMDEAKAKENKEEEEKWLEKLKGLDGEVKKYHKNLVDKHPNFLTTRIVKANEQVEVPKEIQETPEKVNAYYRAHFWDNMNWEDDRLVRSTIFKEKLDFFIDKLSYQVPDSLIQSCDFVLQKTLKAGEKGKEYFKYAAIRLLNKYANSKVICMDKVYVHLAENYYCNGLSEWVDSAQLVKICDDAARLKPLCCNEVGPDIILQNVLDQKPVQMHAIKAKFTAVYFWDPKCNNCSKNSKALIPVYEKYKDKGFEIYGICSKNLKEIEKCKEKIDELKMPWINTTGDAYTHAWAKKNYDIQYNPFMYLLDEEKRIMWKRITPDQLDNILKHEFERLEKEAEEGKK
ncbi:MAG: DUF5106 domain-containing protein [Aureispira sp.]|nr:DUF5106 domain-containing protein [Aureispira sp.]